MFWECTTALEACLFQCPPIASGGFLYYNPSTKLCDWPWNVDCQMK